VVRASPSASVIARIHLQPCQAANNETVLVRHLPSTCSLCLRIPPRYISPPGVRPLGLVSVRSQNQMNLSDHPLQYSPDEFGRTGYARLRPFPSIAPPTSRASAASFRYLHDPRRGPGSRVQEMATGALPMPDAVGPLVPTLSSCPSMRRVFGQPPRDFSIPACRDWHSSVTR
jgi:hypothetical protein